MKHPTENIHRPSYLDIENIIKHYQLTNSFLQCKNSEDYLELSPNLFTFSTCRHRYLQSGIMNRCTSIIIILIVITVYALICSTSRYFELPSPPVLDEKAWWGKGEPTEENDEIKPFRVSVPQSTIDDLHRKLRRTLDFQLPLEGAQQQYGFNTINLKNIIEFWLNDYHWKEREDILNKFPQYTVRIQGLNIHYLHVKPHGTLLNIKVLPLLILHGWPSSVREFFDLIPILTTPAVGRDFVFEVIAPSLPGFAFSEAPSKPGLGSNEMAVIFKNLMDRLGFSKYYVQGGDWGGNIAQIMVTLYGDKILGMHSTFCFVNTRQAFFKLLWGSYYPAAALAEEDDIDQIYPLKEKLAKLLPELGYMHIQATYPDTLGVALRDSPAGLAAYLLEKFSLWTNPSYKNLMDGGLTRKFKLEDLLDNVMIYWTTGYITTSMRLYAETFTWKYFEMQLASYPTFVPAACARFKHDLIYQPKFVLQDKFHRLLQLSDLEGGHFASLEVPNILAEDIFKFVQKVEEYMVWKAQQQREKEINRKNPYEKVSNNNPYRGEGGWERERTYRTQKEYKKQVDFKIEL